MNAIRQEVAAAFFLISIHFVDKKKIWGFVLCCIIAVLFHKLSMILFIAYPLLRVGKNWFNKISVQLVLYALALFIHFNGDILIRLIETPFEWITGTLDYERYRYEILLEAEWDNRSRFGNNTGLGIVFSMLKNIPIILLSKHLKDYYKSSYFDLFYVLYFVCVLSSLIFGRSIILNRVNYFLGVYQLIILSFFAYYCFNTRKRNVSILGLMVMLIQIPLFVNMISNKASTAQYSFFWEGNQDDPDIIMFELNNNVLNVTDYNLNTEDNGF